MKRTNKAAVDDAAVGGSWLKYELEDVEPPSPDALERALEIFRAQGLTTY